MSTCSYVGDIAGRVNHAVLPVRPSFAHHGVRAPKAEGVQAELHDFEEKPRARRSNMGANLITMPHNQTIWNLILSGHIAINDFLSRRY